MLIVGAKGFAKEVLEVFHQQGDIENLFFYDDVSAELPNALHGFPVLRSIEQVADLFKSDSRFTLGVGNPELRFKLYQKFSALNGRFESTISPHCHIGHYGTFIGEGCNIMTGTVLTNDVQVGRGCLINLHCTIGHDCVIEQFTEISPNVSISGNCHIGEMSSIGTGAVILPKVRLGNHVTVGAGAVVTKDVSDYATVVGIPAKPLQK